MVAEVETLLSRWSTQTEDLRADSAARRLIPLLPEVPLLHAAKVGELLAVSDWTGREALAALVAHGVLDPVTIAQASRGRPTQYFAATALLDATHRWAP